MPKIVIGSESKIKINAVRKAIKAVFENHKAFGIKGINVPSMVCQQPIGWEETYLGARNRAQQAIKLDPKATLSIGIENGIFLIPNQMPGAEEFWIDQAFVVMFVKKSSKYFLASSAGLRVPTLLAKKVLQIGQNKTTIGRMIHLTIPEAPPDDPHSYLTKGKLAREDILAQTLEMLFYNAFAIK